MSASLVGSEMCIRDRAYLAHVNQKSFEGTAPPLRDPNASPGRQVRPEAVSYTHLTLPTICSV
eukprot:1546573-Alexandrium_andersonii.AAC.1